MKKVLLSIAFIICAVGLYAQESGEVVVPLSNAKEIGLLVVDVRQGKIEVTGAERSDVLIKYKKTGTEKECEDCDEDKMKGLKRVKVNILDLDISEKDNRIKVNSDSWNNGVDLVIEVPRRFNLDLDSYLGDIVSVRGVSGDISLEGYTGDILAKNIKGVVNASTYSGNIEVEITALEADKAMAFSNYSGDIDLTFPATFASNLKMRSKWGDIFSAFDLDLENSKPVLKQEEGQKNFKLVTDSWTYAKINGGGNETMIKTTTGNIYLRKKQVRLK